MATSTTARRRGALRTQVWVRRGVQLGFLAFIMYAAVSHQVLGGGPTGSPSVEAYCPLGGLESAWKYITTGQFLNRITSSTMILTLASRIVAMSFCEPRSWTRVLSS